MNSFFIVGTDTEVGKTHFALRWLKFNFEIGKSAVVYKPLACGVENIAGKMVNPDLHVLSKAANMDARKLSFISYQQPLAPACAEIAEKCEPAFDSLVKWCKKRIAEDTAFEGVGGLMVPIIGHYSVLDLISRLKTPVVLVARCGLGTINHSLLSVDALRMAKINIAALVLSEENGVSSLTSSAAYNYLSGRLHPMKVLFLPNIDRNAPISNEEVVLFEQISKSLSLRMG